MMDHKKNLKKILWYVETQNFASLLMLTILSTILIVSPREALANNLSISNLAVTSIDTNADTITFSFDVSQDNSWRSSVNNDAVWIFLKYSTDGGATWNHASMNGSGTNPSGFSPPTNFEIIVLSSPPPSFVSLFFEDLNL